MIVTPFLGIAEESIGTDKGSAPRARSLTTETARGVSSPPRGRPFEVTVNGSKTGTWVLLEHEGDLYAPLEALIQWRLEPSQTRPPLRFRRIDYHALSSIPGYAAKADFSNQSVDINFAPEAFGETRHGALEQQRATAGASVPSVMLDYELNLQRATAPDSVTQQSAGLLGEVAFASPLGLISTSFIGQQASGSDDVLRFLRLESTFTYDSPGSNRTLHLGDTRTRMGMLGNSIYYGGFRIGTDFSLTPGFISQPLPIAKGVSSAPSTVDLYVNDVLRQTTQVPSGPFTIENIPPMNNAGDIRMVVRDVFGRETVITRSFFSNARLLSPGLSDWSLESGRIRYDLGTSTSHYCEAFARGFLRFGVTENLTLEGIGEGTGRQKNLLLGASAPVGTWLGSGALATSQTSDTDIGHRWLASLDKSETRYSISLQAIGATENYRTLASDLPTPRSQLSANFNYAAGNFGSFGFGVASMRTFDEQRIDTQSANYSFRLGARGMLSFVASRSGGTDYRGMAASVTLVLPFDKGPTAIAAFSSRGGTTDTYASATENPTHESPLGWRTLVGRHQGIQREEAGISYWGRRFQLTADASHNGTGSSAQRLSASGGMVLAGGHLFAQRDAQGSLALVEVPGYADVRVGLNNRNDTRTSADGTALVPNLMAYQENAITLNAQDLPISAELDSIEQTAVPGRRNVVRVRFPVRSGQGALLRIVLEEGKPPPPGATIRLLGETREFFFAKRGEAFVTGLQANNKLRAKHPGGECEVIADVPPASPNKIARIGPLECRKVPQ